MELTDSTIQPYKAGNDTFDVPAGKTLRIETSPSGENILEVEVPAGKTYRVIINVNIKEV